MTEREMFEKSLSRPSNYFSLTPAHQWEIDKNLGILDWEGEDGIFEYEYTYECGIAP